MPLYRVGRWRAAVGAHAAARLPAFHQQLAAQARRGLPRLRAIPGIEVLDDPAGARGSWPFFLLLLPDPKRRDAALAQLWQAGLGVSWTNAAIGKYGQVISASVALHISATIVPTIVEVCPSYKRRG